MVETKARGSCGNSGDFGAVTSEELIWRTTEQDKHFADYAGNFGEIPPSVGEMPGVNSTMRHDLGKNALQKLSNPNKLGKDHPEVYRTVVDLQSAGKKIRAKYDAHKGATLFIGSTIALGAFGGFALVEYNRRKNKK